METGMLRLEENRGRHPCIWMQAKVVGKKYCSLDYDCPGCRFDRIMGRVAHQNSRLRKSGKTPTDKRAGIIPWQENLRALPAFRRPCLHHMKGRINFRACNQEYRCGNCDFDQYFNDQFSVHAVVKPVAVLDIKGFRIPQGYYFHRGHTWMKIEESGSVRIGIDEFILRLLGPFDSIESPLIGKQIKQGRADITVNREGFVASVLSPVSGVVTSTNTRLRSEGSLANKAPFSKGWVLRVHAEGLRNELKNLMINRETGDFMDAEVEHLHRLMEEVAGPLPVDGGHLSDDIYGKLPRLGWKRLTRTFLHT
ncbi:MAG: glycine cleavage system protein H [Proteobacteria bacterium]|nr:glycine cleavage system protein H [Pseudomonadota bacterium]